MQKAPIHQSHVYRKIKISRTTFEKGHPRKFPVKLFQNLTSGFPGKGFLRISSCPYSARSPHSPEPCSWMDQNFTLFLKRVTQETFLWNFSKIGPEVPKEKIFKELLKNSILFLWQAEFLMETNSVNNFLKRTSQGTFLASLVQTGQAVWEKMFKEIVDDTWQTQDNGHRANLKATLVVLWWANKN